MKIKIKAIHGIYDSGSISLSGTSTTSSNGNHIHTTSLAAEGDDGVFGNSAHNIGETMI